MNFSKKNHEHHSTIKETVSKAKIYILFLLLFTLFQSCKAQQTQTKIALPKIENYTKGELEIKVAPFGLDNPIAVGKITENGTIHFNWNDDISSVQDPDLYLSSVKRAVGMNFCNDKEIEQNNKEAKAIGANELFLYKYGQRVGALFSATQKEMQDNSSINRSTSLVLGSRVSWFYSDTDVQFKATCTINNKRENTYDFKEITSYDIQFTTGWNMVLHALVEKEDWKNESEKGSLPKTITKTSITKIPKTMNWYVKYWANDELLEIEHQLVKLKPITKEHYENWLPKKIGNLKRKSYKIGKKLDRMPTTNNIELLFEKGDKKATVTIVDCAQNKEAVSMYTLMLDMASRDWKDKTDTGYRSALKMDDTRVMIDYNEKEAKTILSYNTDGRFLIKAVATNIKPEELWNYLKNLKVTTLIK